MRDASPGPIADPGAAGPYVYAKTILPSTLARKAIRGNFRGPRTTDLLVAHESALSLYDVSADNQVTHVLTEEIGNLVADIGWLTNIDPSAYGPPQPSQSASISEQSDDGVPDILLCLTDAGVVRLYVYETIATSGIDSTPPSTNLGNVPQQSGRLRLIRELVVSPPDLNPFNRTHRLSVDPLSRAFAVSALKNSYQIFLINNTYCNRQLRNSDPTAPNRGGSRNWDMAPPDLSFDPRAGGMVTSTTVNVRNTAPDLIQESRIFTVPGTICQLAFLHPWPQERHRVLLTLSLVLDSPASAVSVHIYEFWVQDPPGPASTPPAVAAPRETVSLLKNTRHYARLPFPRGSAFPLHLMALADLPESFLVVDEREMAWIVAEEAASGHVHHPRFTLPTDSGGGPPVVTSAAAAAGGTGRVYLSLDDQRLLHLTLTLSPGVRALTGHFVPLPGPAGEGLCVLSSDRLAGDTLFVAGDLGDHHTVLVTPARRVVPIQTVPNIAPVLGMALEPPSRPAAGLQGLPPTLWLATGSTPAARLRRLRQEIRLNTLTTSEPGFTDVCALWHIPLPTGTPTDLVALAFPEATRILQRIGDTLSDVSDRFPGLEDGPTSLLCAATGPGNLVQVTRTAVHCFGHLEDGTLRSTWRPDAGPFSRIAEARALPSQIVLVLGTGPVQRLCVLHMPSVEEGDLITASHWVDIPTPVSALATLADGPGAAHIFLATYDAQLRVYRLSAGSPLKLVAHVTLPPHPEVALRAVHSVALIRGSSADDFDCLLGLRGGTCVACPARRLPDGSMEVGFAHSCALPLGNLPVRLVSATASSGAPAAVLAVSDRAYLFTRGAAGPQATPLAMDPTAPLAVVSPGGSDVTSAAHDLVPTFLAVVQQRLVTVAPHLGPRATIHDSFPCPVTPKHLKYDALTDTLMMVGHNATIGLDQLLVVDPTSGRTLAHQSLLPREQIFCLTTWIVQDRRRYRYFCVGTGLPDPADGSLSASVTGAGPVATTSAAISGGLGSRGRVVMYNVKRAATRAHGESPAAATAGPAIELKFVWDLERQGTVTRMAGFGRNGLLVAARNVISLFELNPQQRKLKEVASVRVDGPVRALDVYDDLVCIAPVLGPLQLWRFDPTTTEFHLVHTSGHALHVCRALILHPSTVLAAGQIGGLLGLARAPAGPQTSGLARRPPGFLLRPTFSMETYDTVRLLEAHWLPPAEGSNDGVTKDSIASWDEVAGSKRFQVGWGSRAAPVDDMPVDGVHLSSSAIYRFVEVSELDRMLDAKAALGSALSLTLRPSASTNATSGALPVAGTVYGASLTGALYGFLPIRPTLYHFLAAIQTYVQRRFRLARAVTNGHLVSFPGLRHPGPLRASHAVSAELVGRWLTHLTNEDRRQALADTEPLAAAAQDFTADCETNQLDPFDVQFRLGDSFRTTGDSGVDSSEACARLDYRLRSALAELDQAIGFW
ncbi:hypothetical protein IWQ60_010438 [Tieghemiomyces parasiticus]|uniref:Cleavage/polyadenylation specificity factor A subunit N-terminal domain-containing protein n=1 Tax=Tieghemiomyces parasiticus TaxID=78921 RepID=A0A9W8DIF5_9FUNG|nr:hypothetical protein IWQ60_010438 [Tieghemiomyces parasiticus]